MSVRSVNGRFAMAVGVDDAPTEGWAVCTSPIPVDDPQHSVLSFHDPSGHLSVTGRLEAVSEWAADLLGVITMIQVSLVEAGHVGTDIGGPADE